MAKTIFGISFTCLIFNCLQAQPDPLLKGKMAVDWFNHHQMTIILDGKIQNRFELLNTKDNYIDVNAWLNKRDILLATLFNKAENEGTVSGSLITIDTTGKILDTLYRAKPYEIIQHVGPSPDDKLLFTGFTRGKYTLAFNGAFFKPISFEIWDLETKTVLKRIDDFCPSMFLSVSESSWSSDSKFLTYAVLGRQDRSLEVIGELNARPTEAPQRGIYIYDVANDSHKIILSDGYDPIWSPRGNLIAFKKDNQIFCYDVEKQTSYRVYKPKAYENLRHVHWTPDGQHLFLRSEREYFRLYPLYNYFEKWINVKTKRVRKSQGPRIGRMNRVTWKQ